MSPTAKAHPVHTISRAGTLLLLLGMMLAFAPRPQDDGAMRSYLSANGFLNRGLYDLAADEYRAFLAAHPDHEKVAVARYGLGASLFHLGEYEAAAEALEQLREQRDFEFAAEALLTLGQAQLARNANGEAARAFGDVRERYPDHDLFGFAAALQAEALYRNGDYVDVTAPCEAIRERTPDSPFRERAELFWGLARMARGEHGEAAALFQEMTERYPDGALSEHTALLLAQSLHRSSALDEAIKRYRNVIQTATDQYVPDALYGLALVQHLRGEPTSAREILDRLLDDYADHGLVVQAHQLRGRAHFDEGDFDRAATDFDHVAETDGDLADDAVYWRAKCDLRRGDGAEAARRLEEMMQRFPESELQPEMHYDWAVALIRVEQPDEALALLSDLRGRFPEHRLAPSALHLMAITEHRGERYDRSGELCATYLDAYADGENAADVAFLAAENLFLTRAYEEARQRYARFLETHPEDQQVMRARFRLGLCAYHLGDCEAAAAELDGIVDGRNTEPLFRPALLAIGDCHFQNDRWSEATTPLENYLSFGSDQAAADDAMLKLGLAYQRLERHDQALEAFELLIDTFGQDSDHHAHAIFERGQVLVTLDRDDEAVEAFTQVLETDGDGARFTPHAHNHLGALATRKGDHAAAAEHYRQVVSAAPDDDALGTEASLQVGQALLSAGELDAAAQAFADVTTRDPASPQARDAAALQAIALSRAGRRDDALAQIAEVERTHLADLDDELAIALRYEKAWCLRAASRPDDAAAAYREMLAVPSDHALRPHASLELAELDFEAGRLEEAANELERLRQTEDLDADLAAQATYRLGVCRYHQDQHEQAVQLLGAFVEETESDDERVPSARLLCAEALFELGRHEAVVEQLTRIVESYPDDEAFGPALLRLGESQAALQRWPDSRKAFTAFLEERGDSPLWYQAQFGVGWALENQSDFEEAMSAYRQVVNRHQGPTAARAQFQIGECLFAQKRYGEAARALLKVDILYAYPEWSAAAVYEAGRCFEELSNPVEARQQFEQVIAHHPDTEWAVLAAERLESLARTTLPGR